MNKRKEVILSAGIIAGISLLLFTNIVQRSGFPQVSHAQTVTPTPTINPTLSILICPRCFFTSDMGDRLTGKDLKKAYLDGVTSSNVNYSNADLKKSSLEGFNSSVDNFTGVSFVDADLSNGLSSNISNYTNADFTGVNLTNGSINGNNFTGANFTNANLTQSSFTNNTFTSVTWSNTTCADGTNSNNNGNTCIGHLNGQ